MSASFYNIVVTKNLPKQEIRKKNTEYWKKNSTISRKIHSIFINFIKKKKRSLWPQQYNTIHLPYIQELQKKLKTQIHIKGVQLLSVVKLREKLQRDIEV